MKKWEINKRKIASIGVLGAIATIGIFAGTYAKYVTVLDLPGTDATDQSARVAVWNVDRDSRINAKLFSPYYYGASGSDGSYTDSGHDSLDASGNDTVFANSADHNVIAPGTHGYKTIRISNKGDSDKGTTEVTYKLVVGETAPSASFGGNDIENLLANTALKFAILTDIATDSGTGVPTVTSWGTGDTNATYTKIDSGGDGNIQWISIASALESMYGASNGGAILDNVTKIKDIVVLWKWDFERGTESTEKSTNNSKETALATQTAASIPSISINFGTMKAEQVD
ncbi:MAG: hypothetical protein LBS33_04965 [Streptococcaceae bacterium]|jgi:hypothetical protein|nr:hypothetical protein [Streptococcaceae bacterium]